MYIYYNLVCSDIKESVSSMASMLEKQEVADNYRKTVVKFNYIPALNRLYERITTEIDNQKIWARAKRRRKK